MIHWFFIGVGATAFGAALVAAVLMYITYKTWRPPDD